jgi:uncharacterized protein YbjT (DUF2867 family)
MRVLVTAATGYIGGRLVPELLRAGHTVRVLVRSADRVADRPWSGQVEVVVGDVTAPESLRGLVGGMDAAYYLVHSMGAGGDFAEVDRRAARSFAGACGGIPKVIYLGGLLPRDASEHLRSRAEVGEILRFSLPTTELRAGPIIGSGSASFEMVRYLTERLPIMITPRWVENEVQPIGIADALRYLLAALERPALGVVDIGADRLTFRRMMEEYAEVRGLTRTILPVPVLAPWLAARWVGLVTPIPNRLAVPLVEGLVTPVVADTGRAESRFPEIQPRPYRETVADALQKMEEGEVATRWSGAQQDAPARRMEDQEGLVREVRSIRVDAPAEEVFRVVTSLGGDRGWPAWNTAWRFRGALDRLVGGSGLRRGRRHPTELLVGEAVDFWRVDRLDRNRLVRLRAEMRLPGAAWLQWEITSDGAASHVVQTALFAPTGLTGLLYWYGLYPVHGLIFSALVRAIGREAEGASGHRGHGPGSPPPLRRRPGPQA